MASAAFREEAPEGTGSEMVRRLLNHSTRARSTAAAAASAARPTRPAFRFAEDLQAREDEGRAIAGLEEEIARLETELRVVRAALQAEQAESAALRAELDQVSRYATPVGDIRHDRDRWASLVERLLFVER
jgi:septal ring factor EnvC (AmiA/AmiB activator)